MKRASKFAISPQWKLMLLDMGIDPQLVLAYAKLPADLYNQKQASVTPSEYFQLWLAIDKASGDMDLPLVFAKNMKAESFDAPIFASICSPNLNIALTRLSQYKPLIGPMIMDIQQDNQATKLSISCYDYHEDLPLSLSLSELVFFTQLARLATREKIIPLAIELPELPHNLNDYEAYFGCRLTKAKALSIHFRAEDADKPFLTQNLIMWEFFEDKLNQKLADLDSNAKTVDRIRAVLLESLPSGKSSIEHIANKLAMSKRTLQRKLTAETETYQSVLQSVRSELADHYLKKSKMSLSEISFLLGFNEVNSFIRAYSAWKGVSPGHYRETYLA
ncbi:AraC family transcriptional regulator [Marinomonas sp. SBI22]|uniref:AraC family transcriptional regulator n=1 Tax=unclassified Marinomonas TaxID=196814 RepID=UPI0007AFD9B4|nr:MULTISPECIES: AraC family transcriptional regulator [unclassified Marinomonas]KZM40597.1 AraC family transcriptional regulator [Marinomonas sp. SBI22]KZM42299.1 AraC family transcriptional regulator [Marinomonas sp. SBI8L]